MRSEAIWKVEFLRGVGVDVPNGILFSFSIFQP